MAPRIPTLAAALALVMSAALGAAAPAMAREHGSSLSEHGIRFDPNAPGPASLLDNARDALAQRRVAAAREAIELAQTRLLNDSQARNLPAGMDRETMHRAVPVLDRARQALARNDIQAATAAVAEARRML